MLGKPLNAFSPNLNFLRLVVFKILQCKVNNFSLASVLPVCDYCDRRLTFGKLAYVFWKAANFTVLNLYFVLTKTLSQNILYIENQEP